MNLINNKYGITLAFVRACAMKVTELMLHEIRKEPPGNSPWYVLVAKAYMDKSRVDDKKSSHVHYACGWNIYSMRFMGLWPDEKLISPSENIKVFSAIFFMFFFVSLPQTINLFFIWGDFDLVVENLSMDNMTISIAILKTIAFWFNGKSLKGLLNFMEKDRKEATKEDDVKRMMIVAEISRKITITANIMCNSLVVFYAIMHLATNYASARGLFFPAYFPWETKPSPNYELIFFGQLMGSFYACATYSVVDTFVATLVLHVCGQLANLRHELINLRSETNNEFQAKLGRIVKKHEYLNGFTETIENCFNIMLLIQMLGCTITLCLESFQTLESLTGEKDKFFLLELGCAAFYVCYILIQLYLYCYVGERLLSESTEMATAAYECEWYNLSPNEAKCLILIMRRARSPLRITAGKFCSFNHELFSEVVRTSMGYLSVLYAVKTEE
ncbi:odorant receptor 13a-like [Vespa crabro]|uniref:odorant receptor 13a-like n=1 Tax=Vespa crabro TaxID=7445 RepID=UPI001F01ED6F|nr:odorant receptor 13a-like [Vespa crabro]